MPVGKIVCLLCLFIGTSGRTYEHQSEAEGWESNFAGRGGAGLAREARIGVP